ncbi:MAG TPA: histidine phosphatase family protein [Candidatus Saccharimonadales bacterium]|nr:histidine phosphatase family protein [Candidatus Saccharimonadales bacterium]
MAKLILIRHGRSRGNANKGIIQGSGPDPANTLDDLGERQAHRLGQTFADREISPAVVWSSPLARARQTCDTALEVMGCKLPVTEDDRLREMCKGLAGLPGGMEGRPRGDVETPQYWLEYKKQGWQFRHGSLQSGGETAEEVGIRTLSAMNDIADHVGSNATALVFTHGQAIRFGIGAALDWPDIQQVNTEYMLGNCEGIVMGRGTRNLSWHVASRIACAGSLNETIIPGSTDRH